MVMKIQSLHAQEILDARGIPTISCTIELNNGAIVESSVPTGASRGMNEVALLRDGGDRLQGLGVIKAVDCINSLIAPHFVDQPINCIDGDQLLLSLDPTSDKSTLGGNTLLAVSMALFKAHAAAENIPLYEFIAYASEQEAVSLPVPMCNIVSGGKHGRGKIHVQEFLIVPFAFESFRGALEAALLFSYEFRNILQKYDAFFGYSNEGAFITSFDHEEQILDLMMETMQILESHMQGGMLISLDVAASQLYDVQTNSYAWHGVQVSANELIDWYIELTKKYPLYSIEDGLSEVDWKGWQYLYAQIGEKVHCIGDDIFVSSPDRIWEGINQNIADGVVIKPSQIGTVSGAIQSAMLCKEYDRRVIVSHRSGETNDDFIADFAVGLAATHIKAGGIVGGEHIAKYNRLCAIEQYLKHQF